MSDSTNAIKRVLVIEYIDLPKYLKDYVTNWYSFRNDVWLSVNSNWDGDWSELTMKSIVDYLTDQGYDTSSNVATIASIKECGLDFEVYLINEFEKLDIPDEVVVRVRW